jgi:hypothetical protein
LQFGYIVQSLLGPLFVSLYLFHSLFLSLSFASFCSLSFSSCAARALRVSGPLALLSATRNVWRWP